MDKQVIARRFARAMPTYGHEARVQEAVALHMTRLLEAQPDAYGAGQMVEFGCGTGNYSRLLWQRLQPASLLLNDLCPEMQVAVADLLSLSPRIQFVPGDAERMAWPMGCDVLTSCSTVQWFADLPAFFRRCHEALRPGGLLAFTTFGRENVREIRALTGHGLPYPTLHDLTTMLSDGYDIVHIEEELRQLHFPSPAHVLRHLKQTGVTVSTGRIWTRSNLLAFTQDYQTRYADADGRVTLTYHPVYVIARKQAR